MALEDLQVGLQEGPVKFAERVARRVFERLHEAAIRARIASVGSGDVFRQAVPPDPESRAAPAPTSGEGASSGRRRPRVISITSGSLRIRLGARDIRKAAAYMVAVGLLFGSVDQAAVQAGKAVEDTSALIEQIQALDDSDTGARKSKQRLQGGSLDGDVQLDSVAATSTSLDDLIREAAEAEEPASRDSEA
jgi:hypothetical protein